ncbi:MAG TPA: ABC transporter ATP-binding protein [Pyrinomonadaceae bacterium]|nr:ABC transporter ATP-binding protein [Pyrinomonadaceae bacterium]
MLSAFFKTDRAAAETPTRSAGFFLALRYIPMFIRLVWATHRGYTVAMVVFRVARAFTPVVMFWVSKLIIDEVIAIRAGTQIGYRRLWELVALEFALVLVGEVLTRASGLVESLLGDLFSIHISVRLMEHAAALDLEQFENPSFYDVLERARRQIGNQIGLITSLTSMGQDALTLFSLASALLVYKPWLLLLLALAVLPSFFSETRFAGLGYSLLYRWTPQRRQLDYLRYLGTSNASAKELHMFGLARWLIDRYVKLSRRFYKENKRLATRKGVVAVLLTGVGSIGYYTAYVLILVSATIGQITLGTLTFLAASFARSRDLIGRLLSSASEIYEQCLYLKDLFDFFAMQPVITSGSDALAAPRPIREGFVFENVGFRYPGSQRWAIRNVNFALRPGERLALVGENGAGKTTLTKLLARLYDPTEGRILLDGRDLREYDLVSLRQSMGVIFQDFVCYDLHLDENIGVGRIEEVETYLDEANEREPISGAGPNMERLVRNQNGNGLMHESSSNGHSKTAPTVPASIVNAAEKSMAETLLPRLPKGYRQMLGRRFAGGVNLSGGEWQKIALARAYMRDAQVLILDEPTAALDARAEYEAFNRFAALVRDRIAILISHRFSTVRMADKIIVLKNGTIVEGGTHDELVASAGLYAELFKLQAVGYR